VTTADIPARGRWLEPRLLVPYGLAAACLILVGITSSQGFAPDRILRIVGDNAALGIVAIGQAIVLLSRGLDLSVGPVMNLSGVLLAVTMAGSVGRAPYALVVVLAAGATVGLVNGVLVAYTNAFPLLATLAVGTIVQGVYFVLTRGQPKGAVAPEFQRLADGRVPGTPVPWSVLLLLGVCAVVAFVLHRTVTGRRFYAAGANPRAAWLSGIPTRRYTVGAYVAAGLCAALAGVHLTAFTGSPSLTAADSYTLTSIAAAVIGGVALTGGVGGPGGTFAGVLVLVFLATVLNTYNVPAPAQLIIEGCVLVVMMLVNKRLDPARGRE
jgi:ribose/xylose/arabinose/galactoside ABC-type transport system permease subunit